MNKVKHDIMQIYIDWRNNYLTLQKFADDYGLSLIEADLLINMGRKFFVEHSEFLEFMKKGDKNANN